MQQEIWFEKYRIIRLLGCGGTARVYLAEHIILNSNRVIKFISKKHPLYDQLRNEAFVLKDLKHSCIPIIYDIEEDEEGSYIIEQYLEGETLKERVRSEGPLREAVVIQYALQLCDLFHYLHSKEHPILYADLKPENVILSGENLKLIDFGSAHYVDELATDQSYSGTRGYAAPELYQKGKIDERCDIYGIGMLLYYMVTGCSITKSSSRIAPIDMKLVCSRRLKNIISRCIRYHPTLRYATVMQLKKQLAAGKQSNLKRSYTNHTCSIAIAGSQPRIGVTHFSFRLCTYLLEQKLKCLYREENQSGCIRAIKNCYEEIEELDRNIILWGIPMQTKNQQNEESRLQQYQIIVYDYGSLNEENMEQFLAADISLLLSGAKDWEITCTETVMSKIAENKDVIYLYNFLNGRQFTQVVKNMEHKRCYRIPYEPDPFTKVTDQSNKELFEELLGDWYDEA